MINVEESVFSRVKNKYPATLKAKYPNTFFTTSNRVQKEQSFPTVYIHELTSQETARDLQGNTINAILATFQIEVTDNVSMSNATEVMNNVVSTMKTMRFEVSQIPEFNNNPETYRKVARFRRVIGDGDVL